MANTVQYILYSYTVKIAVCIFTLAIGIYSYVMAINKYIKQILFDISQRIQTAECRTETGRNLIRDQLIEYIIVDSKVKR